MATDYTNARRYLERLTNERNLTELSEAVFPSENALSPRLTSISSLTPSAIEKRWNALKASESSRSTLLGNETVGDASRFSLNIENFIGTCQIPLGVAGPLRVRGLFASGDYYLPMATTEAALVASCTRGAHLISKAGGCSSAVLAEAVSRGPAFVFDTLAEAGRFVAWLTQNFEAVRIAAESTSRFAKLIDMQITLEGATAYLLLVYEVGEAAGQNMVTIASESACRWIIENTAVAPRRWYVEANLSGDKKVTAQSFQGVRGKKVVAEVVLPGELIRSRLHCTRDELCEYYGVSVMGSVMSGAAGIQGHYANAMAAVFLATGQDVACVAESAVGVTRFEPRDNDLLYASVTLPNLIVGSVGGGTGLPTAQACFDLLGIQPGADGSANALAEVIAGLCLAGELSISAAIASGQFTEAHRRLARGTRGTSSNPSANSESLEA